MPQTLSTPTPFFLHGLQSSGQGVKAQWFRQHFPAVRIHDYSGDLDQRLAQMEAHLAGFERLILIGSSFGGLMASCFALQYPTRCHRLVLLSPALNFGGYQAPTPSIDVPVVLVTGQHDTVCPPELVIPLAQASFSTLRLYSKDDDHQLHSSFPQLNWSELLA
jgi:pimeloyl-ACP methyl ester carboxylesterase